jgi:hypothetical protein
MQKRRCLDKWIQCSLHETPCKYLWCILYHTLVSLPVLTIFAMLLQPKWNDALLEMFRIDYVGSSPRTSRAILRSLTIGSAQGTDYWYYLQGALPIFHQAVAQVEMFIATTPWRRPCPASGGGSSFQRRLVEITAFACTNLAYWLMPPWTKIIIWQS